MQVSPDGSARNGRRGFVYLIPPAAPGSLSDEYFLTAFADRVIAIGREVIVVVDDRWHEIQWAQSRRLSTIPMVLHPSDRLRARSLEVAAELTQNDDVVYLAADMLTGAYGGSPVAVLNVLSVLAGAGARCHVVSMHAATVIDDSSARRVLGALALKGTVSARDDLTTAALASVTDAPVVASPDLGWVHKCASTIPRRHRPFVLINPPSAAMLAQSPEAEALPKVLDALASGVADIAGGADIGVLVHDHRQASGEEEAASLIVERLRSQRRTGIEVLRPANTAAVCALLHDAGLTISSRMHLSIHSLVAGCPTVTIGYGPKFRAALGGVQPEEALLAANHASLSNLRRAVNSSHGVDAAEVCRRSVAAAAHFAGIGVR